MQKNIYGVLLIVTCSLLGYTSWYTFNEFTNPAPVVSEATTTPEEIKPASVKTLTTLKGKEITIEETNPIGESMSTITLKTKGFEKNDPIVLEKNKLLSSFLSDINKDGFDELILLTTTQGSGSYGEATIFTTAKNDVLTPVSVPELKEEDMVKGGIFEGYMGHDSFSMVNEGLERSFPTYLSTDLNDKPTGPIKRILYVLNESNGTYSVSMKASTTTIPVQTTKQPTVDISGTNWIWLSATETTKTTTASGTSFGLTFEKGGVVLVTTNCNTLRGSYTVSPTTLTIGSLTGGNKKCEDQQESYYLNLLTKITGYTVMKTNLILILGREGTMTFKNK